MLYSKTILYSNVIYSLKQYVLARGCNKRKLRSWWTATGDWWWNIWRRHLTLADRISAVRGRDSKWNDDNSWWQWGSKSSDNVNILLEIVASSIVPAATRKQNA